jgi:2-oxoglutarate ferredoxin oxidoreductase subunit beta
MDSTTTTTPYGNLEEPFDLCKLAIGAGAPFVARWTVGFPYETTNCMEAALRKKGFSFVELLVPCPTGYGKDNRLRDAKAQWEWYKANTITRADFLALAPEERRANEKILVGTLWEADRPELTERWAEAVESINA